MKNHLFFSTQFIRRIVICSLSLLVIVPFVRISAVQFIHHSDVVKKIKEKFQSIDTYQAKFHIKTKEGNKEKVSYGTAYYKKGGKINFTFARPSQDMIISNGKKIWVFIKKLNAVGIQTLEENSLYQTVGYKGLVSLFKRYHYRFKSPEQPKKINGTKYFILSLEEKVKSGSFVNMDVYIDSNLYLIKKIIAYSPSKHVVHLQFKDIKLNRNLPNKLFTYRIEGNVKVVENPLSIE